MPTFNVLLKYMVKKTHNLYKSTNTSLLFRSFSNMIYIYIIYIYIYYICIYIYIYIYILIFLLIQ